MNITADKLMHSLTHAESGNFFLLAGPCVIEDEHTVMHTCETLKEITSRLQIPFVFKGSYRKANRSRLDSFQGIGDEKALRILRHAGEQFGVPVVTDIHTPDEAAMAAEYADILQIPAFLCRQTDLLLAAARTRRIVNIKKGQFLSPESMAYAVEKVRSEGNDAVMVTDRGTMFGYTDLIVDFRSIPLMQQHCHCPAVMDITHSLQQPNAQGGVTGGMPSLIDTIGRAAIAVGADGIFMETHPDPSVAKSDGKNMLPLNMAEPLLKRLVAIRQTIKSF